MTESSHEPQQPAAPTPTQASNPTPASVNGDVPVEAWRRDLEQIGETSSAERHEQLSTLLDDLDSQVSSL
ncbi:hypothetical protein [Brevibacterium zhoupengii]|uniref:hypothetical protein n=1 Tax=Brevibacterium zhoupengii TaxID=2898795 RepID=UPI001F099D15|nr:hypothetical protein [Brevibacterium zhoupengii]